jgi:hypothetical protein
MVAETGLTFTSAQENPHDAYAEYMGELPIFSVTEAVADRLLGNFN